MKRVIDEKTLKALYPPMETAFETQMRQTLRSLPVERRHRGARRKPAAVLIAAAVLALLAATALAIAALSGFFTEATALPLNSSYMENWSLGEKEAVAALLVQYDLPEDRAAWEDALQESSAKRREAALDALFIEHYAVTSGGRRNISLHSIMQQELGELDPEWSLEQKAAYSALESEFELGGADEDVKIDANRRYVVFTTNGYTIMSRLIEGDFLNYESVIPKDKKTRITVDCKTFIDTIERASLIITERLKNPLRISFTENKITVRCQTPLGKVVDEFAPVEIGFNNRYLLDALRYSKCEKMVLEINGPLSPVKILPENGKDFIYLVLPVRFKNEG